VRIQYPVVARRGSGFLGTVISLISVVVVLGGAAVSILPQLARSGSPALQALSNAASNVASQTHALSSASWSSAEPGCLIDANGDGVFDIAGLTGPSDTNQATVVDGKTGNVLFTAPAVGKAEQLGCLGVDGFFVVQGNFQVDFYTARSPWGTTRVMARDKVSEYGEGSGCVQLKTDDGTTQGIQLPSGVATTCAVKAMRRYYGEKPPGLMGLTDHGTALALGARKYTMTQRASGTEILTVSVTEGARSVWSKELPYASCTFGAGIAVAAGKILLWAAHPADRDKGLIVGLDEQTGSQLYELPVPDSSSDSPELFQYNGKYVLAVNWGALRAYDPATGAEVWRVGR
jgi:outer membrane protein assembly factor BamB